MDALDREIAGARILELYAGTGALGLEALSRGAASCDFVEGSPSALHALKANVAAMRARSRTRIYKRDALDFAIPAGERRYDVVLADPPYGSRQLGRLVDRWLAGPFASILAVEHARDHWLAGEAEVLTFGETRVSIYRERSGEAA